MSGEGEGGCRAVSRRLTRERDGMEWDGMEWDGILCPVSCPVSCPASSIRLVWLAGSSTFRQWAGQGRARQGVWVCISRVVCIVYTYLGLVEYSIVTMVYLYDMSTYISLPV